MPMRVKKPRRPWTKEEDFILSSCVAQYGSKRGSAAESRWGEISRCLPGRTNKDCRKRWFHSLDPTVRKGRWTEAEDRALMNAYERLGPSWKEIAVLIPGRRDDQCSKRYTAILDPSVRYRLADWTPGEDRVLIANVSSIGHKWAIISAALPGRPPLTCRNRYRALKAREKNAQSRRSTDPTSPLSEISAVSCRNDNRTETVWNRVGEPSFALLTAEEESPMDALDQYQSPRNELPPSTDQHLDISDNVFMDHMFQNGMDLGLEDLDLDPCSDLAGVDSVSGPQVPETHTHSNSDGQYFPGFQAHDLNVPILDTTLSWDTTGGQFGISQAGLRAGNHQISSETQQVVHVVHHHHVYHHYTRHTSS